MSTEIVLSDTVPSEKDENETLKNDEESVSKDEEEIAGIEIQSRTDHVNVCTVIQKLKCSETSDFQRHSTLNCLKL